MQTSLIRPIVLITSCVYHTKRAQQCRDTWLTEWGKLVDYRIVFGHGHTKQYEDELVLDVDDSYIGLPAKIQVSHKWALERGYTHILKTDCDVYQNVPRLLRSGFEKFPYSGNMYWGNFALGAAYWLDRRATEILVNAPLPPYPADGGDDIWVGKIMRENGIQGHHEPRYHIGEDIPWDTCISLHCSGPPRLDMAAVHRRMLEYA